MLKKNPGIGYTRIVEIGKEVGKKYNIKLVVNFPKEGRIEEFDMYGKRDLSLIVDREKTLFPIARDIIKQKAKEILASPAESVLSNEVIERIASEIPGIDPLLPNTLRECLADYLAIYTPEDPENGWEPGLCDLHPCFLDTVQEVHFGRMSVVRTTPDVVDKAYDEALSSLNFYVKGIDDTIPQ